MEHNEDDVIKAKAIANRLGMSIFFKLTWDKGYKPKNVEMLRKETNLNYLSREEALELEKKPYGNFWNCLLLWHRPQINYDGRLLGCCVATYDDFGVNAFDMGLYEAINSTKYRYAKELIQGYVHRPKDTKNIPCINCEAYKIMKRTGIYIKNPHLFHNKY